MKKLFMSIFAILTVFVFAVGCSSNDSTTEKKEETNDTQIMEEENVTDDEQEEETILVTLSIDYGEEVLSEKEIEIEENAILLDVMKENFDIEEEGGFIHSIDGVGPEEGEEKSWMYFVNDEMAMVGAAEYELSIGDHIVFDLQPWE